MKLLTFLTIFFLCTILFTGNCFAIVNPLDKPNNKIGVHILFPTEISQASDLVNSSGGDWGYVTIPIQAGNKDLVIWQKFMDDAAKMHIIPIVRISTDDDYFNTTVWRKPTYLDIQDFANFLNSLNWPTKNRYVIIFNEPNRGDEWGGTPNPGEYATLLSYAVNVFKSKNPDFFIISAGFDNAAITNGTDSMDEFDYMKAMNDAVPGIFNQIDGIASHSYPNPAFSASPQKQDGESIASYRFEQQLAAQMSNKQLPIFITETGWSNKILSNATISSYYQTAFSSVWTDPSIVAITPFLLQGSGSPFADLSLMDSSHNPTPVYTTIKSYIKIKGNPVIGKKEVLGISVKASSLPVENFNNNENSHSLILTVPKNVKTMLKWLLHI